ncbi:MAG: sugar phosphate nucleotidyltransferase [Candidatus Saccharicenans sp.]|jgi:NDP-sugar pyrophosphorylase family protein|nr:sugar phosphate nucleotidyltransferase [Candidatus Saccharicenans sp.]MDH7492319.1 sugar phosphate nucleotidyltransferase [Candidatus Saccharicenans sp.]
MEKLTLVIMAAGIGSRYGGLKQVDPVGPNGELIIDYSLFDAHRAGIENVVFIIRRDLEKVFKEKIGHQAEKHFQVSYVFQEMNMALPPGFKIPEDRVKPWGTGQAVLLCCSAVAGNFLVINADDFYGYEAIKKLADYMRKVKDEPSHYNYALVGYRLGNTLSEHGHVARGICRISEDGYLLDLRERTKVQKFADGIRYTEDGQTWQPLSPDDIASMNIFGLTPSIFDELEIRFQNFLTNPATNLSKSEFYIPEVVGALSREKKARVRVLTTEDQWYGVTYQEDRPWVQAGIGQLIQSGRYPQKLWE